MKNQVVLETRLLTVMMDGETITCRASVGDEDEIRIVYVGRLYNRIKKTFLQGGSLNVKVTASLEADEKGVYLKASHMYFLPAGRPLIEVL